MAKRAVWLAKSRAEEEVFDRLSTNDDDFYRLAKQMDRSNRDVVGENCVRNDAGEVVLSDDDKMKAWVEHYTRLLNIEFEWPSHELPEVPPTAGPRTKVSASLISKALGKMKCGKSAGPSGVVAEMLKAAGDDGVELIRQLAEAVFSSGDIPKTERRVSYSTCTREKGTHSTVGTTVAWSSQTRSCRCWNGPWTSTFARWWTSMKYSSVLCQAEAPQTPFSSSARCKRST